MISLLNKKRLTSVVGLAFEGNRLEAVVLRRTNNRLQIQKTVATALTLSPLTGDPELVGREIRNHLDQAGISERRCAVCLPLNWVLTLQTKVPDLPEADVGSFLEIEAERGFPSGQDTLYIRQSLSRTTGGEQYAMQMAVPRNQLALLEQALKAAQLKPVCFSVGISALQDAGTQAAPGLIALALRNEGIDLQATSGGGIIALRSLDAAVETEGGQKRIDAEFVARELRITIGQLPTPFGESLRKLKVFGRGELAQQFVREISPRASSMGLQVELVERASTLDFAEQPPAEIISSPALALGANQLLGISSGPDFLPPKVSPWKQFVATKMSSRKLAWAGAAAGIIVLGVGGAFGFQEWEISKYEGQMANIRKDVDELDNDQQQIRKYRPWFDETYKSLRLMTNLAGAFPPTGSQASARTLEIRDLSAVTCTGFARDNQSYFLVTDLLRRIPEVSNLSSDVRGQSPLQFTLTFQWEGKPSGN